MGKAKKLRKKETKQAVFAKLSGIMEDYKKEIGEKRVLSRFRKFSKQLAADIMKASTNEDEKSKKQKNKNKVQEPVEVLPTV